MKLSKNDRYSTKTPLESMSESDLRDLKFSLNFRWIEHLRKGHNEAAGSVKTLTDAIRKELAFRAQTEHLKG